MTVPVPNTLTYVSPRVIVYTCLDCVFTWGSLQEAAQALEAAVSLSQIWILPPHVT